MLPSGHSVRHLYAQGRERDAAAHPEPDLGRGYGVHRYVPQLLRVRAAGGRERGAVSEEFPRAGQCGHRCDAHDHLRGTRTHAPRDDVQGRAGYVRDPQAVQGAALLRGHDRDAAGHSAAEVHAGDRGRGHSFLRLSVSGKKCFGLDYNDLIKFTLYIFERDPAIREKWQKRLRYIMIDEFQDIDSLQYELMRVLAGYHKNLFIVGDPDQTIYTWRGANVALPAGLRQRISGDADGDDDGELPLHAADPRRGEQPDFEEPEPH